MVGLAGLGAGWIVVLDRLVHLARGRIGDERRNRVEDRRDLRMRVERLFPNHRSGVVRRPKMFVVVYDDQVIRADRSIGRERSGDVGLPA